MPALPLTLHFFSKVDGFLAAAALVSSSERHSVSMQTRACCVHFSFTVYIMSLFWSTDQCYSTDRDHLQHLRLDKTIPIKGEVPVSYDVLLFLSHFLFQHNGTSGYLKDCSFLIVKCKVPAGVAQITPNNLIQIK